MGDNDRDENDPRSISSVSLLPGLEKLHFLFRRSSIYRYPTVILLEESSTIRSTRCPEYLGSACVAAR